MFNTYHSYYGKRDYCAKCGYLTGSGDYTHLNRHILHTVQESSLVMQKLFGKRKRYIDGIHAA
jgi:hypothetical protein